MEKDSSCRKPEEHHLHLCALKTRLSRAELAELQSNPKYVCANCGGRVTRGRNLCVPKRLKT